MILNKKDLRYRKLQKKLKIKNDISICTDDWKISLRLGYNIFELIENQILYDLKCRNWFKIKFFPKSKFNHYQDEIEWNIYLNYKFEIQKNCTISRISLYITAINASLFLSVLSDSTVDSGTKGMAGLISILLFSESLPWLHAFEITAFTVTFYNWHSLIFLILWTRDFPKVFSNFLWDLDYSFWSTFQLKYQYCGILQVWLGYKKIK